MIKINLNPYKKKRAKLSLPQIKIEKFGEVVYFIPAAVLIILTIIFTFYQSKVVDSLKSEKQTLLSEKKKYKAIQQKINRLNKEYASFKKILYQIELKKSIYKEFSKQKEDFTGYFKIAYDSIPDGVWLNSLHISRTKFKFKGFSLNPINISTFYENLNKYFTKIDFKSVERKSNKRNSFYSFKLEAGGLNKEEI